MPSTYEWGARTLEELTESIADGEAVDWDKLCSVAGDDDIRQLLEQLRIVARVAEVHRSQADETSATPVAPAQALIATAAAPESLKRWGHLLLVRKIGEGAFGEVYEALDTWLDHPRALKLLKPEIASRASASADSARSAQARPRPASERRHGPRRRPSRRARRLLDGPDRGPDARRTRARGRLSAGEATYIGQELCRALAAVHQADLLHRDLKAQNVMRASDGGRIILMDFGAGEFRRRAYGRTPLGTPLYLAPEIITGGSATVQSDIYALGVLLYYLVTGQVSRRRRIAHRLVLAHARGTRRHLRDARPDLPDAFVNVVQRALDPDPQRRFQSAGDLHAGLEERDEARATPLAASQGIHVHPPAPHPQAPVAYTLVGAVAVAALAALCGLVACRTFEVALHVDADFATGPAEYLSHRTLSLIPFALNWLAGIALVTLLTAASVALGPRVGRLFLPWRRRIDSVRPTLLALLVPVGVAICWLASTWWYWSIFDTLWALQNGTAITGNNGAVLDPSLYTKHKIYSELLAVLTFVLVFAIWRWWPWLERRADDLASVRRMKWVSIALILALIISAVAPRRVVLGPPGARVVQKTNRRSL